METSHETTIAYSSVKSGISENISQGYGIHFKNISQTGIRASKLDGKIKSNKYSNKEIMRISI